jgi:hypothetical protein
MFGPGMETIVLIVTGIALALIVFGIVARNRWGINVEPVSCPRCGTPQPRIRRPNSLRQALWGGYTCPACHCEVDKWGRDISPRQT